MSELSNYNEAVGLAKRILHGPRKETMEDAARIIRFLASQETEDVPKLLAEIERLRTALESIVMIGHVVTPSGQGRALTIAIETARKTLEDGGYFDD